LAYRPDEPSLVGPQLRLKRAEAHLNCLGADIAAYLERSPWSVPNESEFDGEWEIRRIRIDPEPDPEWGILASEFVHHLRSTLDNLVWQLVLLKEEKPGRKTKFPIYTDPVEPPSPKQLSRVLRGIRQDHRAFIEELQPYTGLHIHRGPKIALTTLADLSNIDKHRYLHPAFGMVRKGEPPTFVAKNPGVGIEVEQFFGWVYDGAPLLRARTHPPGSEVQMRGKTTIEIAIGKIGVTGPVLHRLCEEIERIVDHFAPDFS
jgi:hypothetical protein